MDHTALFEMIDHLAPEYVTLWETVCNMETRSDDFIALNAQSDYLEQYAKDHGFTVIRKRYTADGGTVNVADASAAAASASEGVASEAAVASAAASAPEGAASGTAVAAAAGSAESNVAEGRPAAQRMTAPASAALRAGDTLELDFPGEGTVPSEAETGFDGRITEVNGKTAAPIALLAHMDTVHEKGAFGPAPSVKIEGDTIYGPGVIDCKGGIIVQLLAIEALRKLGLPHRPLRMLLDSDEESGEHLGNEARAAFHMDGARGCIAALNGETGKPGHMTVGRKGVVRIAVDITGKPGHAGNAYFESISAIREAAYKILAIEQLSEEGGMTFNVGKIEGGNVVNIVPEKAHFEIDIRILTRAQYDEVCRMIQEIADHSYVPGSAATCRVLHYLPPMEETDGNHRLFNLIAQGAHENGLETFSPIVRGGGSDSAFTVAIGIPTVCSTGAVGEFEHTNREYGEISSLARRAKILALALLRI